MLAWMLYSMALTLALGIAALLWERAAIIGRKPARWGWTLAMALSVAVPIVHVTLPTTPGEALIQIAARPTAVQALWDADLALSSTAIPLRVSEGARPGIWLGWAWGVASMLAGAYFAAGYLSMQREYRAARRSTVAGSPVAITQSLGPAVIGWVRPTILLPQWIEQLTESQREVVVAHECEHVRANDMHLIGAGVLLLIVLPWNPVLWWLFARLRLAIEFDCDRRVLRSRPDAVDYSQVLLQAATLTIDRTRGLPALLESTPWLEKRVRAMLRGPRAHDRSVIVLLAASSMAMGAAAASVDTPRSKPWVAVTSDVSNTQPYVLSPRRQFDEQWVSLVDVVNHFEPGVQQTAETMTAYVSLVLDGEGRVASHSAAYRPAFERDDLSNEELTHLFSEQTALPPGAAQMFLQVRLGRSSRSAGMVMLAVDPKAKALDSRAPRVDLAAVNRDRSWMERQLIRRTDNERALIRLADPAAIDLGLPAGTELWMVLDAEGRYVASGRRPVITDPNESRRYVQRARPSADIGDVTRGTPVTDAAGNRVQVSWHWLR